MTQHPPPHIWRIWSHHSHGSNSSTHFAPTSILSRSRTVPTTPVREPPITGAQLQAAVAGHHDPNNRFVFFSDTLTFALQYAAQKKSDGWTEIQVTCLETAAARDGKGRGVTFHHIPDLYTATGAQPRLNRDGEVIDYAGKWVAIDCHVYVGTGSSTASFDTLLQRGLYSLSPELGLQAERRNVRLYSALKTIRKYCFHSGRTWEITGNVMAVAVRLAAAFEEIGGGVGMVRAGGAVQRCLVAWFLAMRKRSAGPAPALQNRLERTDRAESGMKTSILHGTSDQQLKEAALKMTVSEVIDLTGGDDDSISPYFITSAPATGPFRRSAEIQDSHVAPFVPGRDSGGAPETKEHEALMEMLVKGEIRLRASDLTAKISSSTVAKDKSEFQGWFRADRADDRATNGWCRDGRIGRGRQGIGGGRVDKRERYGERRTRAEKPRRSFERGGRRQRDVTSSRFLDRDRGGGRLPKRFA